MIRGASTIGREHVRLGKNNQDAWAACRHGDTSVIVVADGCSSEKSSEVGAQLGARWLASHVALEQAQPVEPQTHLLRGGSEWHDLVETSTSALATWLMHLAGTLGGDFMQTVQDHLLFTFLCAVQRGDDCLVFGVGDGAVIVDDAVTVLDSGDDNEPEYLGYRLLGRQLTPRLHFAGRGASRIALMTDGLSAVASNVSEVLLDGLGGNRYALQRRLSVFAAAQKLGDDATIATLERAS